MEHARKMVLVPEESIERLKAMLGKNDLKSVQTPGTITSRLDDEMNNILNSTTDRTQERNLMAAFNHRFNRFLEFKKQMEEGEALKRTTQSHTKKEQEKTPSENDSVEDNGDNLLIIKNVPPGFQARARQLVKHLRLDGKVQWTANGSVSIDGVRIRGGNIVDLVNHALRDRKRQPPAGLDQFAVALRSASVPQEFIGNSRVWRAVIAASEPSNESSDGREQSEQETVPVSRSESRRSIGPASSQAVAWSRLSSGSVSQSTPLLPQNGSPKRRKRNQ